MRPDQELQTLSRAGSGPAPQSNVVRARLVIITGAGGGEFVYDASNNLRSANVGANTTDPIHGITCFQGFSTFNAFGAVLNLLSTVSGKSAFLQYLDNGSAVQGSLILSISSESAAFAEPVLGSNVPIGVFGVDPVFGDFIRVVGANIFFGVGVSFSRAADVSVQFASVPSANPYMKIDAPEQTTALHMQTLLQGASPDGTQAPQMLVGQAAGSAVLTPVSNAMFEVQGGTGQKVQQLLADAGATVILGTRVAADTNDRWHILGTGQQSWGSGAAAQDCSLLRLSANRMGFTTCDVAVHTAGNGLQVAEGANAKQGVATLVAGTVVVNNTS